MKRLKKNVGAFAALSLIVCAVGIVYHHFGHGVFSPYMAYAFCFPLSLGLFFNLLLMGVQRRIPFTGTTGYRLFCNIHNAGIATLTLYSILQGVFEIAGGSSKPVILFLYAGIAAVALGLCILCALIVTVRRAQKRMPPNDGK